MAGGLINQTIFLVRVGGGNPTFYSRTPLAELDFSSAMTQAQLQAIPKVTITKEHTDSLIQCTVCLDVFEFDDGGIRKLPCSHMYHEGCIFRWLQTNPTCPHCRALLPNTNHNNHRLEDIVRQHYVGWFRLTIGQGQLPSVSVTAFTHNSHIAQLRERQASEEDISDLFRLIIRDRQGQLPTLSVTVNAHNSHIVQVRERQAPEADSSSAPTRPHETLQVVRDAPRRAAALRARLAIQQIWSRSARNPRTKGREN